jgi:outer membrane protein TolC
MLLCFYVNTQGQTKTNLNISLSNIIDSLSLCAPMAKIENLNFENELLQFSNYKKGFLPSLSVNTSPFNFNRSIVKLQDAESGLYNYVEDYSSNSSFGITIQQKILFTGGILSMSSNMNYLNELSEKRHTFNSAPFSINYSQKLFGNGKMMRLEKTIEYKRNEARIKQYCINISNIQQKSLTFFMDALISNLEKELATTSKTATDSLYLIAKIKFNNNRITESELKQVELQAINNQYLEENAIKKYNDAINNMLTFLGILNEYNQISIETPEFKLPLHIDMDIVKYYIKKNNPKSINKEIQLLEAKKNLSSSILQNKFNADINLSYGTNKYGNNFFDVYSNPSRQQAVSISFSIPVSIWGVNRNNERIARNNYLSNLINIEQELGEFENSVNQKINNYNHSVNLWFIAERSFILSKEQYNLVIQEFIMGRTSVYELISSQQEQYSAMQKYYNAVKSTWENYFYLRELTLYDFEKKLELSDILVND